jgi:integrase
VFRTERGTPANPNDASRAFSRLAASVGLAAHPHMLRHALASAMAANREEDVFGPAARGTQVVSTGRQVEGNRSETGASNPA